MKAFCGIDPGRTGAIAFIDEVGGFVSVDDMPPNVTDLAELLDRIGVAYHPTALERQQAMPKQGVSSVFTLGEGYGAIQGVLAALGASYTLTSPSVWKRAMGVTADKEQARAMARRMWPTAPLGRKIDHGRAEALLLAEFRRRMP